MRGGATGPDADFAAYLQARWPALVRTLVLLGCSREEAVRVARDGLARCYGDWSRIRREEDVDARVYAAALHVLRHARRRPAPPGAAPAEPPGEAVSDPVRLRRALVEQLDRLPLEDREVLVLRLVAELDDQQVADVLEVSATTARHRFVDALARVDLPPLRQLMQELAP